MQAKLLRVLEHGEVQRVGSLEPRRVDVHVIAATNRDLRAEVAAGRFRGDSSTASTSWRSTLPPLRDRREDIPYLTAAFVRQTQRAAAEARVGSHAGRRAPAVGRAWEGNVRELRNVIERACILVDDEIISERELVVSMPPSSVVSAAAPASSVLRSAQSSTLPDRDLLVTVERDHIQRALVRAGGNKKAAAKMLGLSRRALYRRLERLDLSDTITRRRDGVMMAEA